MLVEEAVAGGARLWKACEVIGLPARTLQRWVHSPVDGRKGPRRSPANKLTQRERDVVVALVFGQTNAQIAASLFISDKTVRNTLTRIYGKLGVQSRTQAMALLRRSVVD